MAKDKLKRCANDDCSLELSNLQKEWAKFSKALKNASIMLEVYGTEATEAAKKECTIGQPLTPNVKLLYNRYFAQAYELMPIYKHMLTILPFIESTIKTIEDNEKEHLIKKIKTDKEDGNEL